LYGCDPLSYVIGRIQTDSAGVQGAEETIWNKKEETAGGWRK